MLKVVFDTSVLVAVAGRPTGNFATWRAFLEGEFVAFTSEAALTELSDVLARPEIRDHYGTSLAPANRAIFVERYRAIAQVCPEPRAHFIVAKDPKDSLFVNIAIDVGADYLVTYDETHLLPLGDTVHGQYLELRLLAPPLKIVKPAELSAVLKHSRLP